VSEATHLFSAIEQCDSHALDLLHPVEHVELRRLAIQSLVMDEALSHFAEEGVLKAELDRFEFLQV